MEINVGIQAVSLSDGAFRVIITRENVMRGPAEALQWSPPPFRGYYHANLKEKM